MSQSITFWLPRSRAWSAPLGVASSLVVHLLAAGAVAFTPSWLRMDDSVDQMDFAGRKGVVQIQASFVEPHAADIVVEIPRYEAPVVVMPQEAHIDRRVYVQTPVAASDFAAENSQAASEAAEGLSDLTPAPLRTQVDAALPHSTTSVERMASVPKSAATPPMTAGFESAPSFVGNLPPVYPAIAVRSGWSGTVLLKLWIDETGAVADVRIERSSGYGVLDAAAVTAVRQWRGTPKRINGRSLASEELQEIRFRPR